MAEQFFYSVKPMADGDHLLAPRGLMQIQGNLPWRYLSFVVSGVDHLFGWLSNFLNFVDAAGNLNLDRQLQAFSGLQLLFADLGAMQAATSAHVRISFATAALDKLANLRVQLGGVNRGAQSAERDAFKGLCTRYQGRLISRTLQRACSDLNYDDLGIVLSSIADDEWNSLHEHLANQGAATEQARVDRLWSMRNVRHGAFLMGGQFESLFRTSAGTFPSAIVSLPFFLTLGLIADPAGFLSANPSVEVNP